jgi:hypothetical protein
MKVRILTTLITFGPEFDDLFRSAEHTVFRLEMRDRYNMPYEAEALSKFLAGDAEDEHEHVILGTPTSVRAQPRGAAGIACAWSPSR